MNTRTRMPLFAWAYILAVVAALVAWSLPVAIVTSKEGQAIADTEVDKVPQVMVLIALLIAIAGRNVRLLRPLAVMLALLLAILGGALGAFGSELLIDGYDTDADGHVDPGQALWGSPGWPPS